MKAVNHSWWIGAIISTILTFAYIGADSAEDISMALFGGIVNGVFWGWIIGLIIDKLRGNSEVPVPAQNSLKNSVNVSVDFSKKEYEPVPASNNNEYRTDTLNSRRIIIETFQEEMDRSLLQYKSKNADALNDPIFGPMKIMNFINVSSEEYKKSLMNNRDNFRFSEEEIDGIIKKIHSDTLEKNLH